MADSKHTPPKWEMGTVVSIDVDTVDERESETCAIVFVSDETEAEFNGPDAKKFAQLAVAAVNERADLVKALGWFLDDERFQVGVGGNPAVVEKMLAAARSVYARAQVTP